MLISGGFAVVGLHLLARDSSALPISPVSLSKKKNIAAAIFQAYKDGWQESEGALNVICKVLAAALNPRPSHRATPQRALQMLDKDGEQPGNDVQRRLGRSLWWIAHHLL